jgi:peptidoglycan/LPS O-acetylase OafA/YrhL
MGAPTNNALPHLPSLDGLRAIAVVGVLAFHVTVMAEFPPGGAVEAALQQLAIMGRNGVDLFFVLSGFLITGILLSTRDRAGYFFSFYARRALRIMPAYYFTLLVIALVCTLDPELREAMARTWLWYAVYLTNIRFAFFEVGSVELTRHMWSLAIEEQFYLVWPLVVAFLPRRALLPVTCTAIVLIAVSRGVWATSGADSSALYMATWTRADALLVGAVLAFVHTRSASWAELVKIAPLVLALSVGCLWLQPVMDWLERYSASYTLFAIQSAALITLCVSADERGKHWLHHPLLQWIGRRSYGLYLIHFPLALYMAPWGSERHLPWLLTLLLVAALSGCLAAVSFRYIEAPLLKLKDHIPRAAPQQLVRRRAPE